MQCEQKWLDGASETRLQSYCIDQQLQIFHWNILADKQQMPFRWTYPPLRCSVNTVIANPFQCVNHFSYITGILLARKEVPVRLCQCVSACVGCRGCGGVWQFMWDFDYAIGLGAEQRRSKLRTMCVWQCWWTWRVQYYWRALLRPINREWECELPAKWYIIRQSWHRWQRQSWAGTFPFSQMWLLAEGIRCPTLNEQVVTSLALRISFHGL